MLRFNFHVQIGQKRLLQISIHLMLRFNIEDFDMDESLIRFQYILCYGSTSCTYAFYISHHIK